MSKRIHRRFVIALWVFAFGFFAGIAQGRLGYDYRDNLMFYGRPVNIEEDFSLVTWENNGFATKVRFDKETRKARVVSTYSQNWTNEKLQSWIQLQVITFGKGGSIGVVREFGAPDKETSSQRADIFDAAGAKVGELTILRRVFTNEAILTITDLRK